MILLAVDLLYANAWNVEKSKSLFCCKELIPFPTMFSTLSKTEIVISTVYYIYVVVCKCFQFGQGQIFVVCERVKLGI